MPESVPSTEESALSVIDYHERTKHRFEAYAKGPGTLDWDAQPNPFRHFEGAPLIELPLVADDFDLPFAALDKPARIEARSLDRNHIGLLLEISLALSAWKQYGDAKWSLRCNPSSGNLHPTEAYLVLCGVRGLDDGVYHYRADIHGLEMRCNLADYFFECSQQQPLVLLGFSSVHWREAWKYGERAYRYCQHDVGHALAALSYATTALGWSLNPLLDVTDNQIATLLGLNRQQDYGSAEAEHPDILLSIDTNPGSSDKENPVSAEASMEVVASLSRYIEAAEWSGRANVLDKQPMYQWPVIDEVAEACLKGITVQQRNPILEERPPRVSSTSEDRAARIFRQRRSAQGFDGETRVSRDHFIRMMDAVLPRQNLAPWTAVPWAPRIHLALFVHRVEGLKPGLYCLPRSGSAIGELKTAMRPEFLWQTVADLPAEIPLHLLIAAKAERTASQLCCQQPIAGTSCFSLGMIAEFESKIVDQPWVYRELFWEAGAIGQVLYLEAEAAFLRGTGIGCYYDDPVHQLLGLKDRRYQSLYHFTVGGALTDGRIASLPPYNRQ